MAVARTVGAGALLRDVTESNFKNKRSRVSGASPVTLRVSNHVILTTRSFLLLLLPVTHLVSSPVKPDFHIPNLYASHSVHRDCNMI